MNLSRNLVTLVGGLLVLGNIVSCQTTDYSDFELKMPERDDDMAKMAKVENMFAKVDITKKSSFEGKQFEGREAYLRSNFERKDYPEHPYFQLGKEKPLRKGNDYFNGDAREGKETAFWQDKNNSWFKKAFKKREARSANQITRKEFNVRQQTNQLDNRSGFEKKKFYGDKIIDAPNKDKAWTIDDVKDLLNTY